MASNAVPLKGSERERLPGSRTLGPADPNERLEVSLILRRRDAQGFATRLASLCAPRGARIAPLSRAEYARLHGADPKDLAAISQFAQAHGLAVVQSHAGRRTVVLSGTVAQFSAAFNVQLERIAHAGGTFRGRTGVVQVPAPLADVIEAVLGLDNRPQAEPHFRVRHAHGNVRWMRRAKNPVAFTPPELAALYAFPNATGAGQCIGIIELGGGFRPQDLASYFAALGIKEPAVTAVSVDHASNAPTGDANGPDGEVMLDIEVAGAIAPGASIAVYFAPNTDAGFLDAITTALHDETHKPSVLSISWGSAESSWTAQAMTAMDQAFQTAASLGVSICVAAGDNGSSDGVSDGADHVDFPASSPYALACGGTSLVASGTSIGSETVWDDGAQGGATGGGLSTFFAVPSWQAALHAKTSTGGSVALTQRGVPDVAGDADPETGYEVRVDGSNTVIGGTSAVAPLWAALIARLNQIAGKPLGLVSPLLYEHPQALRDVLQGSNGDYVATVGWDACTGLGSPNGAALASALAAAVRAPGSPR
jgi:kumamolisin